MAQKPWYITWKELKEEGGKKRGEKGRLKKYNSKKKERTLNY